MTDWTNASSSDTVVAASSGNVAAATATATLPAVAGRTNYISQVNFYFGGATGASIVLMTIVGLTGGTQTFPIAVPAGVTLGGFVSIPFYPPLPASGSNVAIVASCPTLGAGNTNAVMNVSGFYL